MASVCAGARADCGSRASSSTTGFLMTRKINHSAAKAQPNTNASFHAMSNN